ncbi:hypothetical protein BDN70DRAFT_183212 [Pholiota conissans]|uniref:Uncharacterized protein n=1 Tax=Pholiota conissans TaxID=109636 RepID=A0A9P6CX58_9AGAR|nr:hypothetical protein BDN70DRAFT_183212 [Pholiota conissans]
MRFSFAPARFLTLSACVASISAQTSFLYKWSFQDTSIQTTVPTCTRLAINITSFDTTTNSTKGTPPYYMTTYAIDGTPSTTLIGTKESDVSLIVDYPVGTLVLFSVTDANGSPGGTFAPMTVTGQSSLVASRETSHQTNLTAGASTSCIKTPSASKFTITPNVTSNSDLTTCDLLGLAIRGGVSPYTLSLVAATSPSVTNVTLPAGDNVYTYINRAAPGGHLVAAISDSTGEWATGAAIFNTKGTTDTECSGLASSSTHTDLPDLPSSSSSTSSTGSGGSPASTTTATSNTNPPRSGASTSTLSTSTTSSTNPTSAATALRPISLLGSISLILGGLMMFV